MTVSAGTTMGRGFGGASLGVDLAESEAGAAELLSAACCWSALFCWHPANNARKTNEDKNTGARRRFIKNPPFRGGLIHDTRKRRDVNFRVIYALTRAPNVTRRIGVSLAGMVEEGKKFGDFSEKGIAHGHVEIVPRWGAACGKRVPFVR